MTSVIYPSRLSSFDRKIGVAVIGANGGIGKAVLSALAEEPCVTHQWAITRRPMPEFPANTSNLTFDLNDETTIKNAAAVIGDSSRPLDLVIIAAGILHDTDLAPEKAWRDMSMDNFERVFSINTFGPSLVAKHFLPLMPKDKRAVFAAISARVGSISDNRAGGWYAYRASKAALNMILRNLAIEWRRKAPQAICIGYHPGTVDTRLSAPFGKGIPEDRIFSTDKAADDLLDVIDKRTTRDSGHVFAWDGSRIDP
ncbi:MAG: SDR family NAD(P)-dependent oxidoreductase [Rhodospirillales bacterium]